MNSITKRFLKYTAIDTQSNNHSQTTPSSLGQWTLAQLLASELESFGLEGVVITENCFVHGTLASNTPLEAPTMGLVAYLDTSHRFNSSNIRPQIHPCYDGSPLYLDSEGDIILSQEIFPELSHYIGDDLITTDGTTLLGSNGKAGIAEIMTALETLKESSIPHGKIKVVFTPDQETLNRGIQLLNRDLFDVDFAITLDGDGVGEINFENFNAAHATIRFKGRSAFTGDAKNKMINAIRIASEWTNLLPAEDIPEKTSGYEGFYHIEHMSGDVESAEVRCMIRDFDLDTFMHRKAKLRKITEDLNNQYGKGTVSLHIQDDYYNMKGVLSSKLQLVTMITSAVADAGILPKIAPIRGGSDGAILASMGIPAPNLFSGGHNCHGPYEFISIQAMEKSVEALLHIIKATSCMTDISDT